LNNKPASKKQPKVGNVEGSQWEKEVFEKLRRLIKVSGKSLELIFK